MIKCCFCRPSLAASILTCIAIILILSFIGCASSAGSGVSSSADSPVSAETGVKTAKTGSAGSSGSSNSSNTTVSSNKASTAVERQKAPSLIIKSPQSSIYNGTPRPISFSYTGDDFPEIIYYPSLRALEEERGGSFYAPTLVGSYYVLVRCLYEEVYVEYRILKSPVRIKAALIQEAIFNGTPKRVQAEAEPTVPLYYSYYPNRELRDAAIKAEEEAVLNRDPSESLTEIFKGYRRIDRAPTMQGTYFVWIYFPGDENHEAAQMNIEFTILPAPSSRR